MSWPHEDDEAVTKYGSDRPDLRFDLEIVDLSERLKESGFRAFQETVAGGGTPEAPAEPSMVVAAIEVNVWDQSDAVPA